MSVATLIIKTEPFEASLEETMKTEFSEAELPETVQLEINNINIPGQETNSSQDSNLLNEPLSVEAMQIKYKAMYPQHDFVKKSQLNGIFFANVDSYKLKNTAPNVNPHRRILVNLMSLNYYHHLIKYQTALDEIKIMMENDTTEIPNPPNGSVSSNLRTNSRVFQFPIPGILPDMLSTSREGNRIRKRHTNTKNKKLEYSNWNLVTGQSKLLSILLPEFSVPVLDTAHDYPYDQPWRDKWHPINLSMSFNIFCATVDCPQVDNIFQQKWYIEYMYNMAESNQEFLLAILSAHGQDFKSYPSRVLELLQLHEMLLPVYRCPDIAPPEVVIHTRGDNSTVSNRIATWWRKIYGMVTDAGRSAREGATSEKSLKRWKNGYVNENSKKCERCLESKNESVDFRTDIPFVCFTASAEKWWNLFYTGELQFPNETALQLWHTKAIEAVTKNHAMLHHVMTIRMENDRRLMDPAWLNCLVTMEASEVDNIQARIQPMLEQRLENAIAQGINSSTIYGKMKSQTSSLQILLHTPIIIGSDEERIGIPGGSEWIAPNSEFPYFVFETIAEAQFNRRCVSCNENLLNTSVIKLRYVEFMAKAFRSNHNQFLLGLFTAYGSNLYEYPLRIIQLLQESNLLQNKLGIPRYELNPGQNYIPLKKRIRKVRKVTKFVPKLPSGRQTETEYVPTGWKQKAKKRKLWNWIAAAEKGLLTLDVPALTETGYNECYANLLPVFSRGTTEASEFMKGILTGILITHKSQQEQIRVNSPIVKSTASCSNILEFDTSPNYQEIENRKRKISQIDTITTEFAPIPDYEDVEDRNGISNAHDTNHTCDEVSQGMIQEDTTNTVLSDMQPVVFDYGHGFMIKQEPAFTVS